MADRLALMARTGWLYPAVLLGVFVVALGAGYVYARDAPPDQVVLRVDRSVPPSDERIVSGTIVEVDEGRLVLDSAGRRVEVTLPAGVAVDELQPAAGPLEPGVAVNVGAEQTAFGLVLSGIVAVEGATP